MVLFFGARTGPVVYVEVYPHGARQSEDVDKKDAQYYHQQRKATQEAYVKHPMHKEDEAQTEKSRKNIGDKHGTIVKAGLGLKMLATVLAALLHVKRLLEAKTAGLKHVGLVAPRAPDAKDAGYGTLLSQNRHNGIDIDGVDVVSTNEVQR